MNGGSPPKDRSVIKKIAACDLVKANEILEIEFMFVSIKIRIRITNIKE